MNERRLTGCELEICDDGRERTWHERLVDLVDGFRDLSHRLVRSEWDRMSGRDGRERGADLCRMERAAVDVKELSAPRSPAVPDARLRYESLDPDFGCAGAAQRVSNDRSSSGRGGKHAAKLTRQIPRSISGRSYPVPPRGQDRGPSWSGETLAQRWRKSWTAGTETPELEGVSSFSCLSPRVSRRFSSIPSRKRASLTISSCFSPRSEPRKTRARMPAAVPTPCRILAWHS